MISSSLHILEECGLCWDIICIISRKLNKIDLMTKIALDPIELGLIEESVESFDLVFNTWEIYVYKETFQNYNLCIYMLNNDQFMLYMSDWTMRKFIILYGVIDDYNKEIVITRYHKQNLDISDAMCFMCGITKDYENYLIKINTYRNWTKHEHYTIMWAFENKFDPMPELILDNGF